MFKSITFVVIFCALILSAFQTLRIDIPNYDLKVTRHFSIINNTINYPYKYRLLNPFIAEGYVTVLKSFIPYNAAFIISYGLQSLLVYFFLMFAVRKLFGVWLEETASVIGILMFAFIIPLALTGYDTLGDMTSAGIMALGFYFMNTEKIKYLFPLIFISAFNELQGILLAVFYFIGSSKIDKKVIINTVLLIITFAAGYFIVKFIRGGDLAGNLTWLYTKEKAEMTDFKFNLTHPSFIYLWAVMILPLLYYSLKGLKTKSLFLRRNLFITLPLFYVIAFLFIARMREIDKALTIFVILIPLAVMSIHPSKSADQTVKKV